MRQKNEWTINSNTDCEDAVNFICGKPSRQNRTTEVEQAVVSALITAQMTGNFGRENVLSCEIGWTPTGTGECIRQWLHFFEIFS